MKSHLIRLLTKQARHNLCVVAVERGRLEEAEECLLGVREMAPQLEYVERHLEIVRNRIRLARETTTAAAAGAASASGDGTDG